MTARDSLRLNAVAYRTPNWNKWRLIPKPKLWQCVALGLGIDPDKVNIDGASWMAERTVFCESQEFQDRLDVACANFGRDGALRPADRLDYTAHPQSRSVSLREFVAWVHRIGWEAPAELLVMADEQVAIKADRAHSGKRTGAATQHARPEKPTAWKT